MQLDVLERAIDEAWEIRGELSPSTEGPVREAVDQAIDALDAGSLRVAEPPREPGGAWRVNQWAKRAVLLSFRLNPNQLMEFGPAGAMHWDKVPAKTAGWSAADFERAGFRMVPGALARRGAFIGRDAVLMPSFVNIGAHVGPGTMVDTWASIGSCAQIGAHCHISAGAGIGGVLEPLQAAPTIIEDHCFIGARSEIVEGVVVREGAVISMGVFITQSTKIVDRETGAVSYGEVPPYAVVAPGALPSEKGGPALACAVIVKRVDAKTREKIGVNELLRA